MLRTFLLPLVVLMVPLFAGCAGCGAPATECATDSDCVGHPRGQALCSTSEGACVECLIDEQCESGVCLPDGRCAQCTEDGDCPEGSVCGPNKSCVAGCGDANAVCPAGKVCYAGGCVDCTEDTHCGPGRVCSAGNECVPGCSDAQPQCLDNQVCDVASGTCVTCLDDGQCMDPALPQCDPATDSCVGCLEDGHCTNPALPFCSPAQKTCVECVGDAQCDPGSVCTGSQCVPGCTATQDCPQSQTCDTASGQCVECTQDAHCGGATKVCLTSENRCVECLPGANDTCPAGAWCRSDSVCEQGCKNGADCTSGVCLPTHSCDGCVSDSECAAGNVCDQGVCVAACDIEHPCGPGRTCCSGHCLDTQNDVNSCGACGVTCNAGETCCGGTCTHLNTPTSCGACGITCAAGEGCCNGTCTPFNTPTHCGACGNVCAPGDFCDGTQCNTPTYPNFCNNRDVYVIYDGVPVDNAAANVMASTIKANCPPTVSVTYGLQTNPALVDQATGEPLTGPGSTVVLTGGPWPNKPVKWLEMTRKSTKVWYSQNGVTHFWHRRSNGSVITQIAAAACSPHLDQFIVELLTDPANGTLALIGYGACPNGYGTQAAAWFYANVMLPNAQSYPNSWYIVQWRDGNADALPNAADTFTILASGL